MKNLEPSSIYSILLIENSLDESNHFVDIVKKENEKAQIKVFANSFEAIQWLQQNHPEVLVIMEDAQPMNASQTTDYIRQELQLKIPIFIASASSEKRLEHRILKPFSRESMSVLFENVTETQEIQEQPLFSLDYLRDISDNNMEFIMELLEIFKTSVEKQLQELEIAKEENDYEKAARIAHNIKPSFEMIENEEATAICNNITYDIEDHSLSNLTSELKIIFSRILLQIEKNFARKKS
ncbi:Hpt domain-containing protein [Christiangramia sp.]|uniref:Hpt domain-containing protein n=1 Tax=Christiangramia sp. TaxID=1931228 RepID=UPI0026216CDA|nr:Hpt domain-containing protein [Christiangramia sp.]